MFCRSLNVVNSLLLSLLILLHSWHDISSAASAFTLPQGGVSQRVGRRFGRAENKLINESKTRSMNRFLDKEVYET